MISSDENRPREEMEQDYQSLKEAVQQFFKFIDITEESDSGRIFHPIAVSCGRALCIAPLSQCLSQMRELSK